MRRSRVVVGLLVLLGCRAAAPELEPQAELAATPAVAETRARVDIHVHLVGSAAAELIAALDRNGIARAVVLASPHLDPDHPPPVADDQFASWRATNDRLLSETAAHRDRLVPFVTLDPAAVEPDELEAWLDRGACGVKLYIGHRSLRQRPLDDPSHTPIFAMLERRAVPVLLHVNTFRYEAELDALLRRHPKLEIVCPHLCGSRTDLDRLERIMRTHPSLRVDTSHGIGQPGVDGFANLERERERLRALIEAEPERFLFGSDLVTGVIAGRPAATQLEWDRQIAANLGLLEAERFEFWRTTGIAGAATLGEYRGLALDDAALEQVLAANARRWLRGCEAVAPSVQPPDDPAR